jgi:L-threonylcarbamoyladenylate synthase
VSARVVPDGEASWSLAVEVLRAGGVVAIPTDTVYGLAVDSAVAGAIECLFEAKGRPRDRAVAVLLADTEQAETVAIMPAAARALAAAFWPGGLTLVLEVRPDVAVPDALTGGRPTIGIRVPDHPTPRALARELGPLATSSANRSGEREAATAAEIDVILGAAIDLILDGGPSRGGPPSTVVDMTVDPPRILREGAIDAGAIDRVLRVGR